ncbi:MAG TPA: flagellar M-ring protein FliF C-terminal domain-containing protein [Lacipirellulaceae bacterium]|nr:flagellar M-ring protein FliF C-terminal domain-containing protein [Lacipirellulaceae bacterium]
MNKSLAQVSELFRSMTPGARITAGLLLAVVVISLGYLFKQGTAGPDAFLFGGEMLPDSELTRIEAALGDATITWNREGNRIRVPAGQQAAALAAISDAGALPRNFNDILEKALEKGGPWESAAATRERLKIAKQQQLTEIVRAHYWVEDAVVIYDEQAPRGLSGTKQVTGSVSVRPIVGETLDPRRERRLQNLVAAAVVGLTPQDVVVTNLGEGSSAGSDGGVYPELFEDDYMKNKVVFEMQKRESILNALRDIPGVRVEVNADFNDVYERSTTNMKPDPKPAPLREVETKELIKQSTGAAGGQPGPVAQGPNRQSVAPAPNQNLNETENSSTETENVVGGEQTRSLAKGYTLREIWATVAIPTSYLESLWKSQNPSTTDPPTKQDLTPVETQVKTAVENIVEPLLQLQAIEGEDNYKHVSVSFVPSLPVPQIESPSTTTKALSWAGRYWSTLAMLGVAMFSLMVLRSVVRGTTSGDSPGAALATPALTLHGETGSPGAETEAEPEPERQRLRFKKGKSLKDDLVEIVREDPDAAADILRTWISKAG